MTSNCNKKNLFVPPLKAPANTGSEMSQGERKVFLHLFPRLNALIKRLLNSSTSSPPRPASCHHFSSFHFSPFSTLTTSCLMALVSERRVDLWRFTVNFHLSAGNTAAILQRHKRMLGRGALPGSKQLSAKFNFKTLHCFFFFFGENRWKSFFFVLSEIKMK